MHHLRIYRATQGNKEWLEECSFKISDTHYPDKGNERLMKRKTDPNRDFPDRKTFDQEKQPQQHPILFLSDVTVSPII